MTDSWNSGVLEDTAGSRGPYAEIRHHASFRCKDHISSTISSKGCSRTCHAPFRADCQDWLARPRGSTSSIAQVAIQTRSAKYRAVHTCARLSTAHATIACINMSSSGRASWTHLCSKVSATSSSLQGPASAGKSSS
jgi:hypothetical protein